jgi:peptidoglycan/xylan/chitin deacetylase (PgdA/CDA1 family)
LDQPTFLSAAQVRELQSKGMHIGSHGVDHVSWRRLTRHQLQDDLRTSRVKLGDICGSAVDSAACPFGEYDRVVLGELWNSGYKTVYTSDGGAADGDDWIKPRTTITRGTRLFDLALLVQKGVGRCRQLKIDLHRMIKRVRP